ncbi:hypothetical protein HJP15_15940 [Pseudoalteromonas sp. NEC-BIFX-2020_002]|uniref:hypothetical protein n=1 Tax=Pseudoalteromonas sp. NEC-BIFX-2020_002 TaxID=2732353 RepID=UPI001476E987|nr:hypothetical protein [Pseudoalteromonas sp. NEC-BIFX-2020_002]NNG44395.1 hypothetical protein [Pseudoalteromonas sp. NEC-BIFX-2020_002]
MKVQKFALTKLAIAFGLTASLAGCFSDNDIKTPTQKVQTPPIAVEAQAGSFTVLVTDAVNSALADTIEATITFKSEDKLLTTAGDELTDADKKSTASSFGFTVSEIPETGVTYEFTVTATGYLSNTVSLTLDSQTTSTAQQVRLTPRNLAANENVAIVAATKTLAETAGEGVQATYTADDGLTLTGAEKITLTQELSDAQKDRAVGGVSVSLKNGTKFLDKEGTALASAPSLTVGYFANEATGHTEDETIETSSLDAFPGGLNLTLAGEQGDDAEVGSFTSGGFVAIELTDDAGNKVKTFGNDADNKPITLEVAMKLDKNTANPCAVVYDGEIENIAAFAEVNGFKDGVCTLNEATKVMVEPKHIFPVWSYEETTGQWSFESYGLVSGDRADTTTTFDVAVEVSHLSYWNLDYFTRAISADKCPGRRLDFNIVDADGNPATQYADVLVDANGYRQKIGAFNRRDLSKGTFLNPPAFAVDLQMIGDVTVDGVMTRSNIIDGIVGEANDDGIVTKLEFDNLCDLNGKTIKLTTQPAAQITQKVTAQLVCTADEDADVAAEPVPTPTVVQLFKGNQFLQTLYPNGMFEVSLDAGEAYTMKYKDPEANTWLTKDVTASTTAVTLDIERACPVTEQPVTGTTGGS